MENKKNIFTPDERYFSNILFAKTFISLYYSKMGPLFCNKQNEESCYDRGCMLYHSIEPPISNDNYKIVLN